MITKKTMCFDLSSSSIKIKELMQTKDFIMIELWAISDEYPNNNTSHFPYETMKTNVKNKVFYNKPILGKFNNITLNYESHNSRNKYDPEYDITYKDYEDGERPLGVIRESDNVRIETDDNGLHWIVFTAILWVKYNYQGVKKILKSKTSKVSVEVTVFESHEDENGIEIFDQWMFDGVTILGYRPNTQILAKEGINNAHLTILEKMGQSEFSHQIKSLQFAYDEFDKNNDIKENNSHLYIDKNEEEEGIELLTYEQKRDLLQEQLHSFLNENEWGYVYDLDDNNAFFRFQDITYRCEYTMDEDGKNCTLLFNEKVRIISSWKDFEEDNEIKEEQNFEQNAENKSEEQDFADENKKVPDTQEESCTGEGSGCKEKTEEDQKEEMESDDEDDDKSDNEDDDKSDDSDNKDEKDDDNNPEEKEESMIDGEAFDNNKDEKDEKLENKEDSEEDNKECSCDEIKMESEKMFVVDNVEITAQELFEKYVNKDAELNNLIQSYNTLSQEFEVCKEKCVDYESQIKKFENEKMSVQIKEIAEKKANFSEEEIMNFVDRCKNGEFSSIEDATKEIAYYAFMEKDSLSANIDTKNQTEFSAKADIHFEQKNITSNKKKNPIDELKNYVNK